MAPLWQVVESSARSESRGGAGSSQTRQGWRNPLITALLLLLLLLLPLTLPCQRGRVGGPQGILEHLLTKTSTGITAAAVPGVVEMTAAAAG